MKDLLENSLEADVEFFLKGLLIESSFIEFKFFNMKVIIRQTTLNDAEKLINSKSSFSPFNPKEDWDLPSSILSCNMPISNNREIEKMITQIITFFRLFCVSSIEYTQGEIITDIPGHHVIWWPDKSSKKIFETFTFKKIDEKRFTEFIDKAYSYLILNEFYDLNRNKNSFVTIAYDRYLNSLLLDCSLEMRITYAIMGLESLFLDAESELNHKLSYRVAQLLSFADYDSNIVREHVLMAYKIRSKYVHGDVSDSIKARIEKKYGSYSEFLIKILDYLRTSIILFLVADKSTKTQKNKFLDSIEDSIFNEEIKNELFNELKDAIEINKHTLKPI